MESNLTITEISFRIEKPQYDFPILQLSGTYLIACIV